MADPLSFAIATVVQIGISYLFPSEGPRLKDLKMSASTYGAAIPWVFGLTRVAGNMIWSLPIKEHKKKKGLGKGGSYNQYTYSCTFAMGLCKGPVKAVLRVWADGKLIYDATRGTTSTIDLKQIINSGAANTISSKYRLRFYTGDEEQMPDSAIIADRGEANTPAFRGLAYIMFDDAPLADFGNRIPQITAEVYVGSTENTVGVTGLTEADGTTALVTNFDGEMAAFDWDRGLGYLVYPDHLAQIDTKAATVAASYTETNFAIAGAPPLARLLCVGHEGSVFATFGAGHSQLPVSRLDPYALQAVASFGAPADAGANTLTSFTIDRAATALTNGSIEYLLTLGPQGQAGLLRADTLAYQWGAGVFIGGYPGVGADAYRVCGADPDTTGDATFYVLSGSGAALTLTKVEGSVQTEVQVITGTDLAPGAVIWDSSVPGVVMLWSDGGSSFISKWSADTGAEAWRKSTPGSPAHFSGASRLLTSTFAWVHAGILYVIDTTTGEFKDRSVDAATGDITEGTGTGFDLPVTYAGADAAIQAFDSGRAALFCADGIDGLVQVSTATAGVTVGSIVTRMLIEGGLEPARMNVTALNAISLRGYGWASGTDIKGVLDELRRLFLFDLVERQGVLTAVMRGDPTNGTGEVVDSIQQNVLGSSSSDATDFWQETRLQEADLPASVSLAYMNYKDDYETSMARSARVANPLPTMFSRQQLAMEINIVMTPNEAKQQTNKILYSQWLERTKYETRLPWAYLELDPADLISVTMNDGRSYTARLDTTEIGADFAIRAETYAQDSGAYDGWEAITVADGGGSGLKQVIAAPAVALPFVINTPLLRDQDDTGGSFSRYYVGVGNGDAAAFTGGALFRSTNNLDYAILTTTDNDVEWGTILGVIPPPAAGPFALDWKTRITIKPAVNWFDIESITDDELWNGANPCLVGNEVIQFRDAVENADGTWTIWNLLRCRRGTEYAGANHAAGERFIFLNNNTISLQGDLTNARGLPRYFKGLGEGRSLQDVPVLQTTYEPRDLMPYAPVDIRRERTTGTDIEITWARRTRLGGNMMDGTGEVALAERTEAYEVYFLDAPFAGDLSRGAPPAAFRRKYATTSPIVTYTGAQQGRGRLLGRGLDAPRGDLPTLRRGRPGLPRRALDRRQRSLLRPKMDPVSFVIMEVVQVAIAYLFPSQGPRMKDLKITASTYGASIPWTFGVTRVAGNMIWSQPIREHKRERMNGKGGFYIQYKYTCSFAMGLCRGPLTHVRRVWADGKLLYDRTGASEIAVPPGVKMRFYMGTEDQLPNSTILADKGEANTPAYRGLAYIVFDDLPLDNYSNRIPQITAEVYKDGVGAGFGPFKSMTVQGQVLGSNTAFANYQNNQLFVDMTRGYYYLRASILDEHGVTVTGLQRYSISGASSNLLITDEMHAFPNTNEGRDNQQLWSVIGVSRRTGQLMVQHGFANNVALDILDAGSYRTLATIGTSTPFPTASRRPARVLPRARSAPMRTTSNGSSTGGCSANSCKPISWPSTSRLRRSAT
jgi:hypothetical protein